MAVPERVVVALVIQNVRTESVCNVHPCCFFLLEKGRDRH
jgi:hypothetical protein